MGKVLDLQSRQPHMAGHAQCLNCQYKWEAVAEIGTLRLECPECHTMKGVFRNLCDPSDSIVWFCECGNDLFIVGPNGCTCCVCGVRQVFPI